MDRINAENMHFKTLNEHIRKSTDNEITIENTLGQRFIGSGCIGKDIHVYGIPGNALGAYLHESDITVYGNAQDATGDAMNNGTITIHGNCGDAPGYGMRDGKILIKGSAGYRAGIHMKEYMEKSPVLMIGGKVGDFLAEYQAGGTIIVLGIGAEDTCPVGAFCGTGMHGGKMFLRSDCKDVKFPSQVTARSADETDLEELKAYVSEYCEVFGYDMNEVLNSPFTVVTPDSKNPYKQMYVAN